MKLNAGVVGVYYIKSLVDGKLYIGKSKNENNINNNLKKTTT